MLLASDNDAKGEVVNVGNTQEVTILEIAEKIREATGSGSVIEFYPLPKDDPKGGAQTYLNWKSWYVGNQR